MEANRACGSDVDATRICSLDAKTKAIGVVESRDMELSISIPSELQTVGYMKSSNYAMKEEKKKQTRGERSNKRAPPQHSYPLNSSTLLCLSPCLFGFKGIFLQPDRKWLW